MVENPGVGAYSLELGGDWDLNDLSVFRQYLYFYSFMYALHTEPDRDDYVNGIHAAFEAYPWTRGWSAIHFCERLRRSTPPEHQPRIVSIQYASPGHIDLSLVVEISIAVSALVTAGCYSIKEISAAYTAIHRDAAERKLLKADARFIERLRHRDREFCENASAVMIGLLGLKDHERALRRLSGNPLQLMKLLFSACRRLLVLIAAQLAGKIKF